VLASWSCRNEADVVVAIFQRIDEIKEELRDEIVERRPWKNGRAGCKKLRCIFACRN